MELEDFFGWDETQFSNTSSQSTLEPEQYRACPYNNIGLIKLNFKGRDAIGTAFLISSCLVMTSAHTFYKALNGEICKLEALSFSLSENGSTL